MENRQLGHEIFTVRKSIKLAIAWTAIFILPVVMILESFFENKNIHALLFALALASPAIYMFITAFTDRLKLYEKAIVEKTLFGTKTIKLNQNVNIYIERIAESFYGLPIAQHAKIHLKNIDTKLKISSLYKDMAGIIELLENFQMQSLLPSAIERFHQSQTVSFGDVKINTNSLSFKKKSYKWADIDRVEMEAGVLRLYLKKKKMLGGANDFISVKNIANLDVFLVILSEALHLQMN